jgi:molybdopterin converting factor subunit 1
MTVCVLLFAAYREAVGQSRLEIELPHGATAGDLFEALQHDHPDLERLRPYTTFAVNRAVCDATTPLGSGDEVAFLQPVSGGSR